MDDFGRTELTEAFLQRCFDFIAAGLEDIALIQVPYFNFPRFRIDLCPTDRIPHFIQLVALRSEQILTQYEFYNPINSFLGIFFIPKSGGPCFGALPFGAEPQRHRGRRLSDALPWLQRRPGPATAAGAAPRGTAERGLLRAAPADATGETDAPQKWSMWSKDVMDGS